MDPANCPRPRLLVTGAAGLVGTAFVARANGCDRLRLSGEAWREAIAAAHLRDAVVVHLAARVHEPGGRAGDFDRDNVGKTVALAEAAASAGAARFVFASTVKVHGEETQGSAFRADSPAAPADAYARSKWKAEESLRAISARTGMPLVVVRFPLAYGPGVAGNFRALLRLADSGTWLPLAAIENRRSLVHVRDLAEALLIASTHRAAPGRAFIAAHPEAVSTPGLVAAVRAALGRPSRLFRFPPALLEAGASVLGLGSAMRRLTRSLEADPGPLVSELGWQPRLPLPAGLVDTVGHWRKGAG